MHCLFTMIWWLSEATLGECLNQALCNLRTVPWDESKAGAAWVGSQSVPTEAGKTQRLQRMCFSRGVWESSSLSPLIFRQSGYILSKLWLWNLREQKTSSLVPTASQTKHQTPEGFSQTRWSVKIRLSPKSRFALRATVLCKGNCHPPHFENGLPTV